MWLTNIFVGQFVRQSYALRLVLDRVAIDNGHPEELHNRLVYGVALVTSQVSGPQSIRVVVGLSTYKVFHCTSGRS